MALRRKASRGHDLFPGFTDVHEIGVGSLAVVFRAREIGTNRQVALKLLNVRDASPRSIESFERESIALGALSSHPNIVTLFRTFRTPDGRPVLVLELCSGAISDRLRNGAGLPVPDAVSIGIKVAGALETAHRGGILHRDVKPQNILVTEFGEPALADFGVAMLQSSTQTTAGLFDFTTLHAAPELLEGGGTSAATDVYELASSLYQLIAGQSAFRAYEGESPASVILRILRDPVRPLSGTAAPLALSDLLIRAMSKEQDERPPTAAEFAAELADIEISQGWNRTQFLIRDPGPSGTGAAPSITRMPDAVPRGLPSTLAPSGPIMQPPPQEYGPPPRQYGPSAPQPPAPNTPERTDVPVAAAWSAPTIVNSGRWAPPAMAREATAGPQPPAPAPEPARPQAPVPQAPIPQAPIPQAPIPQAPAAAHPEPANGWWSPPPAQPEAAPSRAVAPASPPAAPAARPTPPRVPAATPPAPAPSAPMPTPPAPMPSAPMPSAPIPAVPPASSESRRRRPVEIDDDYFPASAPFGAMHPAPPDHPPVAPPPAPERYVPDHAAHRVDEAHEAYPASAPMPVIDPHAVPVWAVRAPANQADPGAAMPMSPQFSSDLSLDPMSLRKRATLRAGASSVVVDDSRLRVRTWFRRVDIDWRDVLGFEAHLDTLDESPASTGQLLVLTTDGPVELPGTRRTLVELRYVHALLDAYRLRAAYLANR